MSASPFLLLPSITKCQLRHTKLILRIGQTVCFLSPGQEAKMKVHLRFIKLWMSPRDKGIHTELEQQKRAAHFQANQEDAIRLKIIFKGKPGQYGLSSALSQKWAAEFTINWARSRKLISKADKDLEKEIVGWSLLSHLPLFTPKGQNFS